MALAKRWHSISNGEIVKFRCLVSKHVTQSYKWYFNDRNISNDISFKIKPFQFIKIKAHGNHSGSYVCVVRNQYGINNVTYYLTVKGKPSCPS